MQDQQSTAVVNAELGIDDLLAEFRVKAARHGMHDQVMDLTEGFIRDAYKKGLADARRE